MGTNIMGNLQLLPRNIPPILHRRPSTRNSSPSSQRTSRIMEQHQLHTVEPQTAEVRPRYAIHQRANRRNCRLSSNNYGSLPKLPPMARTRHNRHSNTKLFVPGRSATLPPKTTTTKKTHYEMFRSHCPTSGSSRTRRLHNHNREQVPNWNCSFL